MSLVPITFVHTPGDAANPVVQELIQLQMVQTLLHISYTHWQKRLDYATADLTMQIMLIVALQ